MSLIKEKDCVVPEVSRKKQKLENEPKEKHCLHFIVRKARYCKMTLKVGRNYCGEHLNEDPAEVIHNEELDEGRVICPLDPRHTVYKSKLSSHLKICNAREKEDVPEYIKAGCNSGSGDEMENDDDFRLADIDELEMKALIEKVNDLYEKHVGTIETIDLQHKILAEEIQKTEYGPSTLKHLVQTSSILGILDQEELLQPKTCFIDFGAGKAQVSVWLALIIEDSKLLDSKVMLVDKASHRHKKDNKIIEKDLTRRVRADISDLDLNKLDGMEKTDKIVGVSKHLCGAATDLTLRCMMNGNKTKTTAGFLIAVCCHHRCSWKPFVGKKFMLENGIDQRKFKILAKMVSWAVCGTGTSREVRKTMQEKINADPQKEADRKTKQEIGIKCKRLIDMARVKYLTALKCYDVSLKYYVDSNITLENVCLIGKYRKCE